MDGTNFNAQTLQGYNDYQPNGSGATYMQEQLQEYHQQMFAQQQYYTPQQHASQYYDHSLAQHQPVVNEPVTTRQENYLAPLSVLTQIQNTLAAMQAQIDTANKAAEAAQAAAHSVHETAQSSQRKQSLKEKAKETKIQALIQSKMRWAIGVGGRDVDGKKLVALPHPLQPGQEPEMLDDAATKKSHPNWLHGVADPVNALFLHEITKLCMEHTTNKGALYGDPTWAGVLKRAKRYFGSLRKSYTAQNTEEGAHRRRQKQNLNKRRSRKHEKADDHRKAIPKFRETHGEENTVGDYDAVQTDDMSSEHSNCGNVGHTAFEAHRRKAGGGENGWEVRKKRWHSTWLDLFFAHLKTIRRDMLAEAQALGANGSLAGKHRVPRFKGLRENQSNDAPLLVRKKPLYQSMVSSSWLEEMAKTHTEVGAVADPENFTLFKLKLDTTGLNAAEIEYLADDES
ncbi:hypothetical protein B0H11DRAFT_2215342 [Mycena galericulata]|nr:hypothetical protein B0H11DRAFT_2215342 [Mycena galericulata]